MLTPARRRGIPPNYPAVLFGYPAQRSVTPYPATPPLRPRKKVTDHGSHAIAAAVYSSPTAAEGVSEHRTSIENTALSHRLAGKIPRFSAGVNNEGESSLMKPVTLGASFVAVLFFPVGPHGSVSADLHECCECVFVTDNRERPEGDVPCSSPPVCPGLTVKYSYDCNPDASENCSKPVENMVRYTHWDGVCLDPGCDLVQVGVDFFDGGCTGESRATDCSAAQQLLSNCPD